MALLIIIGFIILIIVLNSMHVSRDRHAVSAYERVRHRTDEDSHIYYYQDGELIHERERCNGCAQLRVKELQRSGAQIDEVVYGRRNTGDLAW